MQVNAPRGGMRSGRLLWVAVLLAVCSSASVAFAAGGAPTAQVTTPKRVSLAGTWSGSYTGAFKGTFTLHWRQTGSKLHGSITLTSPRGTYTINGSVTGKNIKFGAVGVGATYTGSVSGASMSGSWKSPEGGGSWSAKKKS